MKRRYVAQHPKSKSTHKFTPIKDDRQVKNVRSSYIQFSIDRHASGDFVHMTVVESARLIGREWKALDAAEKKVNIPWQPYFSILLLTRTTRNMKIRAKLIKTATPKRLLPSMESLRQVLEEAAECQTMSARSLKPNVVLAQRMLY